MSHLMGSYILRTVIDPMNGLCLDIHSQVNGYLIIPIRNKHRQSRVRESESKGF